MSVFQEARLPTAQSLPFSPERKTRHIPFPGQLLVIYSKSRRGNRNKTLAVSEKLRQLGDIRRDPPRLVFGQKLGR